MTTGSFCVLETTYFIATMTINIPISIYHQLFEDVLQTDLCVAGVQVWQTGRGLDGTLPVCHQIWMALYLLKNTHRPVSQNSVVLINRTNTFLFRSQLQPSGDPQSPTVSPCLHRCRSGQDLSSKCVLGDETISRWRGGAAATPMT